MARDAPASFRGPEVGLQVATGGFAEQLLHRTPNRLRARDLFFPAEDSQFFHLFRRQIDNCPHVISCRVIINGSSELSRDGAKFIRAIEFSAEDKLGFWEVRGYSNTADPWTEDRFS